jgi:hypothetical protein
LSAAADDDRISRQFALNSREPMMATFISIFFQKKLNAPIRTTQNKL